MPDDRRVAALILGCLTAVAACAGSRQRYPQGEDGGASCVALAGCTGKHCCGPEHLCASVVCEGREYVCSVEGESYGWVSRPGGNVACDDGDPCTTDDLCVSGTCLGVPNPCDNPPASVCVNDDTLRTYSSQGSCSGGVCNYPPSETACPQGCREGQCTGAPCLGVKCDKPPSACYANPGTCKDGKCEYTPLPAGSPCSSGASCQSGGVCDDQGNCKASGNTCSAPNATGTCVNGACQFTCSSGYANCNSSWADGCEASLSQDGNCGSCGRTCTAPNANGSCVGATCKFECKSGWGNCNGSWDDGCETSLTTNTNCGGCGKTCSSAPHATASCSGGACKLTCVAPYQDCDKNAANGCEIPVGVANKCDKQGLNSSNGCGTAYCGSSSTTAAANFGTWTCVFCTHCHHYSDGYAWCLFNPGPGEFSPDRCTSCCNASLADHVCPK